jgi:hypothetical protein
VVLPGAGFGPRSSQKAGITDMHYHAGLFVEMRSQLFAQVGFKL